MELPNEKGEGFLIRCKKQSPKKCKMRANELCRPHGIYRVINKIEAKKIKFHSNTSGEVQFKEYNQMIIKCAKISSVILKNGDVFKGVIIEEKEGEYIQIQFKDENQKRIKMSEIEEIKKTGK